MTITTASPTTAEVLAVTELSYTALLAQHTVWRSWSRHGHLTTHLLVDMDRDHLLHVRAHLAGMAAQLHELHLDQLARDWRAGRLTDDQFQQEHAAVRVTSAHDWLDSQPLLIQIDQLTRTPAPARGLLRRWRR